MSKELVLIIVLLTTLVASSANALIQGNEIPNSFPVVRISFKSNSHICSGVFVDSYTILTAAHCISDKKIWPGFSLDIEKITDKNNVEINFDVDKLIPHPNYRRGFLGSKNDIGVIKIKKNQYFSSFPKLSKRMFRKAIFYGCGIHDLESHTLKCSMGKANVFGLMGNISSFGSAKNYSKIDKNISVAPHDSGGAVVNENGEIFGVIWGTWVKSAKKYKLPSLNFATPLYEKANYDFVNKNMGEVD